MSDPALNSPPPTGPRTVSRALALAACAWLASSHGLASDLAAAGGDTARTPKPQWTAPVAPRVLNADLRDLPLAPRWYPGDPIQFGWNMTDAGPLASQAPGAQRLRAEPPANFTPAAPPTGGPASITAPLVSFEGINFTGFVPPDTNGDVGPDHYIQTVNAHYAIWDKSGTLLAGPSTINTLWSGTGGLCDTTNRGDPIALWDGIADRWLITQFGFDRNSDGDAIPPFVECIALSRTADPVSGGWWLYEFDITFNGKFPDYPKLGVWPDAYYMSTNQFGGSGGGGAFAFQRTAMLAGGLATVVYFDTAERQMLPADLDGVTLPPAGAPNPFLKFRNGPDQLELREFQVDFATPANSTFTLADTPATAAFDTDMCGGSALCIDQPDCPTQTPLDPISDRVLHRLQYRNFGSHETLVVNHTVDVDGSDRAGVRWYELRHPAGVWSIQQQGTYSPDATDRWMGSAAMDGVGDIAIGYSVASPSVFPGIRYAGRLPSDPPGTLPQGEQTLIDGGCSQTFCQTDDEGNCRRGRWGDYTSMSVDPTDDCTFWYTNQYIPTGTNNWATRIGSFCIELTPPTVTAPSPLLVECNSAGGVESSHPIVQAWLDVADASDNCAVDSLGNDAPPLFPSGCAPGTATDVEFEAVDSCGNQGSASSTVTVRDTTAPALVVPPPITVECSAPGGTPATDAVIADWLASASATDVCGTASISHDAPALFPSGCAPGATTTVSFTATDECGNETTLTSTVTVQDTTPPALSVPAPITVECSAQGGTPSDDPQLTAWFAAVTAPDVCDGSSISDDAPALFPSGCAPGATTAVVFEAVDNCDNTASAGTSVTVQDTQGPIIDVQPTLADTCSWLWPPNHGYADFELDETGLVAHDVCNGVDSYFGSCTSSQPENGLGDGDTLQDCTWLGQDLSLRAERGQGCPAGRTYTMTIDTADNCDNVTTSDPFSVLVPHAPNPPPSGPGCSAEPGSNHKDSRPGWMNGSYLDECP